jgi:hypothetical protein
MEVCLINFNKGEDDEGSLKLCNILKSITVLPLRNICVTHVISSYMTYYWVCIESNTTGVISGRKTAYPSGEPPLYCLWFDPIVAGTCTRGEHANHYITEVV